MTRSRLVPTLLAAVLIVGGLAGCVVVPTSGAVHDASGSPSASAPPEITFVPRGPVAGQTPAETIEGFFSAMLATPVSATVARSFLTDAAARRWQPQNGYLTYDRRVPIGRSSAGGMRLEGVNRFDAQGSWDSAPPGGRLRLGLRVEETPDGPRLSGVPDALIVSDTWFEQETDALSAYFFSLDGGALVAEPVFVPRGAQRATQLVQALLAGPVEPAVEQTFLPTGTELNLSVTMSDDGTAEVPLRGDLDGLPQSSLDRLAAQLAATLRQVPEVERVKVLANGRPLPVVGDRATFDVTTGAVFDLAGLYPEGRLFGLREGRLVRVEDGRTAPVTGPFGQRDLGVRAVSLDVSAQEAAGVTADGRRLLLAPVATADATPQVVLSGRADLLRPAWDATGRLWVVDATPDGAEVLTVEEGQVREVPVPGVSGRDVRRLLVSADGTRLVAVVRRDGVDAVVQSRLAAPASRRSAPTASVATPVSVSDDGTAVDVRDVAWHGPTELAVLTETGDAGVRLDTTLVDGTPLRFATTTAGPTLTADQDTLVGSGRADDTTYVGAGDRGFQPARAGGWLLPDDLTSLTYAG